MPVAGYNSVVTEKLHKNLFRPYNLGHKKQLALEMNDTDKDFELVVF